MTFLSPLDHSPGRDKACNDNSIEPELLKVFPPKPLDPHFRNGWRFRSDACTTAFAYDPDFCVRGAVKMDPEGFGPERDAVVGMIQSAFNCSPVGETIDFLRGIAEQTLKNNLWRAIEADLVASLAAFPAVSQTPAPIQAVCALAEAAQFLATHGNCGKGIIVGPYEWFVQLSTQNLIWNGTYHTDVVGNIVIPLSTDNDTVYAFDSNVDIRISEVLIMDERAPSIRSVNDRIVRAEQIFGVAIDPCVVASFKLDDCCGCSSGGGGGGGGGNVAVTNFPANQPVTVTNFPASTVSTSEDEQPLRDNNGVFFRRVTDDGQGNKVVTNVDINGNPYTPVGPVTLGSENVDDEALCDDANGILFFRRVVDDGLGNKTVSFVTASGAPYTLVGNASVCGSLDPPVSLINVSSHHFDVTTGSPWTSVFIPPGRLTGLSYTVVTGLVDSTDADGTMIIGLPAGLTLEWQVQDDRETLIPVQSITAQAGGRAVVTMSVATP